MATKNSQLIGVGVIALIIGILLGSFVLHVPPHKTEVTIPPVSQPPVSEKNVIEITDIGFTPSSLTINAGEVVTFISKATAPVWPAGDAHPTHDAYPSDAYNLPGDQAKSFGSKSCVEYGIRKGDVFDPCKMLLPEQTFSFKFNEKGTWGFHNHVRPEHTGTIIVE
jgi:plastocyanin